MWFKLMSTVMSKLKSISRKLLYSEGVNPLPGKLIMCIFLMTLFIEIIKTMVFSFLPKLVKNYEIKELDVGYKVGMIVCSMYIGRVLCLLPVGIIADRYGRKLMLLILSPLLAIFTIMFGFSYNYEWTIITRFFQGCTMGVEVVSKSLIREYCDNTNTALGMSILIAAFSCGLILGPSISGFLAFPDELYPNFFQKDSIFSRFGILLPCLLFSSALIVCIFISAKYLPPDKKKIKQLNEGSYLLSSSSSEDGEKNNEDEEVKSNRILFIIQECGLGKVLRLKSFLITCIVYGLTCFNAVAFDEMFPVYAATSKLYNGYGFSTVDIGESLLGVTILILILEFTFIPRILHHLGSRKIFIYSELIQALLYPLIPTVQRINNRTAFWIVMLTILFLIRLAIAASFLGSTMILNNSLQKSLLGIGNGLGTKFGSIGRIISPILFGQLFTWSLKNIKGVTKHNNALGFPFNQYFIFILLSFFALIGALVVTFLPKALDKPVEENNNTLPQT